MKKLLCVLVLFLQPAALQARAPAGADAGTHPEYYISTNEEGIDSALFLPPPPAFDSLEFLADQAKYQEGLALRGGPAGKQAIIDAIALKLHDSFSPAFGISINEKDTPAIHRLIYSVAGELGDMATRSAKQKYFRMRPYVLHKQSTCYPAEEKELAANGSYPSGHSARGWGIAMLLAEINPDNREALLKRGHDIGQSRVICGYHCQSDVNAGRLAGAAGVAALRQNPKFQENMRNAVSEFQRLKAEGRIKKVALP